MSIGRVGVSLEESRKPEEAGSGFEPEVRDVRADEEEEFAEDLAIARQALDEYEKRGIEGTISYNEYRRNRQIRDSEW